MSRSGKVEFDWADGHHVFRLGIGEIEELEEKTGSGIFELFNRLRSMRCFAHDVREPLRLGLIGAGMAADAARKLVNRYAGDGQLYAAVAPALTVVNAAMVGVPEEAAERDASVGKDGAAMEEPGTAPPPAGSTSPPSTDPD